MVMCYMCDNVILVLGWGSRGAWQAGEEAEGGEGGAEEGHWPASLGWAGQGGEDIMRPTTNLSSFQIVTVFLWFAEVLHSKTFSPTSIPCSSTR